MGEKLTYKNVRTKLAAKPTSNKNQKSVANELIFALSKPKIKKEIKEEKLEDITESVNNKKLELKDFQATVAKNIDAKNIRAANTVKLSNKTNLSAKRADPKAAVETTKSAYEVKTALKNKVNNDWINSLKKRQDTELPVAEDDILELEETQKIKPQLQAKRKRNNKKDIFSTELPVSKYVAVNPEVKLEAKDNYMVTVEEKVGKDVEKDLILENLLNQVAQLETSMGSNISKLESKLKDENEKSRKLQDDLEAEKENYSDTAIKLVSMQQNKVNIEVAHKKEISEIDEKLRTETRKTSELSRELTKIEKVLKDEKQVK